MITAVIFDLYGVLALNGWQAFKAKHFADRLDVWDQIFQLGRMVDAGLAEYDELIRFTAEQAGVTEATVHYQLEHTIANEKLLKYITDELNGHFVLGILSNASRPEVVDSLFSEEQRAMFGAYTFSKQLGRVKPDVLVYEAAANQLEVGIDECLFVDDQERHANGAKDAGMQALLYTDFDQFKAEIRQVLNLPAK